MGLFDTVAIAFTTVRCFSCGVIFGIESGRDEELRESHNNFWCPNGHSQHYVGQTENEKRIAALEREAKALRASKEYLEGRAARAEASAQHSERRVNGYKGVVARTKRKIAAGRCPCCSHQFKDLERHMKSQHPAWNPDRSAEALASKD